MYKKLTLTVFMLCLIKIGFSQIAYGLRGGMDYNFKPSLTRVDNSKVSTRDGSSGFHMGGFLRFKVPLVGIFVMPEVLYRYQSVGININNTDVELTNHKIDIPIFVGKRFFRLLNLYLGPNISYNISSDIDPNFNIKNDNINLSGVVGTGIEVWKFMLDIRYQFGIDKNNTYLSPSPTTGGKTAENNTLGTINQESNFISLSLAYKF